MREKFMKHVNGFMIDCSRLLEKKDYYTRLIDFMSDWGMNVLLLHFSDDHGCSIRLPHFSKLAAPHAFSPTEIRRLISHAASKGIEVIPELACFGHSRYITNYPEYAHLFAGRKTGKLELNALDVFNPETTVLIERLIKSVSGLFPSKYIHLGCDEVNIKTCCNRGSDNEAQIWSDYVNKLIGFARANGKIPMIWADHPINNKEIMQRLRKDVILIEWMYAKDVKTSAVGELKKAGFNNVILAPSVACSLHRFLPTASALENTRQMIHLARKSGSMGLINTAWCPWRYLQNALYYGIAYSACMAKNNGRINKRQFHHDFADKVFGTSLTGALEKFLCLWTEMEIDHDIASRLIKTNSKYSSQEKIKLGKINEIGKYLMLLVDKFSPNKNRDIWNGMVLAVKSAWLCSESYMLCSAKSAGEERKKSYNIQLRQIQKELSDEWDRTRYSDDTHKYKAKFSNSDQEPQYVLILMRRLRPVK